MTFNFIFIGKFNLSSTAQSFLSFRLVFLYESTSTNSWEGSLGPKQHLQSSHSFLVTNGPLTRWPWNFLRFDKYDRLHHIQSEVICDSECLILFVNSVSPDKEAGQVGSMHKGSTSFFSLSKFGRVVTQCPQRKCTGVRGGLSSMSVQVSQRTAI